VKRWWYRWDRWYFNFNYCAYKAIFNSYTPQFPYFSCPSRCLSRYWYSYSTWLISISIRFDVLTLRLFWWFFVLRFWLLSYAGCDRAGRRETGWDEAADAWSRLRHSAADRRDREMVWSRQLCEHALRRNRTSENASRGTSSIGRSRMRDPDWRETGTGSGRDSPALAPAALWSLTSLLLSSCVILSPMRAYALTN